MCKPELQNIKKAIQEHFRFLFEQGFFLSSTQTKKEHMDYWEVVLLSKSLTVQIYNDRGEIMLSVGPRYSKSHEVYGLGTLVYFITQGKNFIGFYDGDLSNKDLQLKRLAEILKGHINKIHDTLANLESNTLELQHAHDNFLVLIREEYLKSRSADDLSEYVPK